MSKALKKKLRTWVVLLIAVAILGAIISRTDRGSFYRGKLNGSLKLLKGESYLLVQADERGNVGWGSWSLVPPLCLLNPAVLSELPKLDDGMTPDLSAFPPDAPPLVSVLEAAPEDSGARYPVILSCDLSDNGFLEHWAIYAYPSNRRGSYIAGFNKAVVNRLAAE